jgi:hypothetical protein
VIKVSIELDEEELETLETCISGYISDNETHHKTLIPEKRILARVRGVRGMIGYGQGTHGKKKS